jgi:acyl-coenzyme A synthetase/AMP-(fatty) acid ligase
MLKSAHPALNREACHQPEHEPGDQAQKFPGNIALRMDDQVVTYGQPDEATARLAQMMISMGVGPGDRIGLMVPNARLAAYKYPRRVWLMESLPKGPTGKILRREVKVPPEARQT